MMNDYELVFAYDRDLDLVILTRLLACGYGRLYHSTRSTVSMWPFRRNIFESKGLGIKITIIEQESPVPGFSNN
jgi:hypothetical protein